MLTFISSQHTVDVYISVILQWEQHQQSRTCSWDLHQSVCCGPLQPCWLQWHLRTGCAPKHGVLSADQPHPETGPLPEPAEPRPPQRHMTTYVFSFSLGHQRNIVLEAHQSITCCFTTLSSSHPPFFTYLWMETRSWSGIWRGFTI